MTTFDFSHLFRTETVNISPELVVVVREIPHGDYVEMQKALMGDIKLSRDKNAINRQIENIKLSAPEFADRKAVLGIQSWTLKDASGKEAPVCIEAWRALPHHITEVIEKAIDDLNPDIDDEFQD